LVTWTGGAAPSPHCSLPGRRAPVRALAADRLRTVGYLSGGSDGSDLAGALAREGRIEGRDVRFEIRVASDGKPAEATSAASSLAHAAPDVMVTYGSVRTIALMRASRTIPIVCGGVGDPVAYGIARTLARPGHNVTGLSNNARGAMEMLAGLMRLALPRLERLVAIRPPAYAQYGAGWEGFEAGARRVGVEPVERHATSVAEINAILARPRSRAGGGSSDRDWP
jgi:putative ABC transport system substrate-binding protein